MSEYQRTIQPHLEVARELAYRCAREIRRMPARPAFFTLAQDELEQAEREVNQVLTTIQDALREFAEKPVESTRAA